MRPLNEIIVHCTATRAEWWAGRLSSDKVAEVRKWHVQDRGWRDIVDIIKNWCDCVAITYGSNTWLSGEKFLILKNTR